MCSQNQFLFGFIGFILSWGVVLVVLAIVDTEDKRTVCPTYETVNCTLTYCELAIPPYDFQSGDCDCRSSDLHFCRSSSTVSDGSVFRIPILILAICGIIAVVGFVLFYVLWTELKLWARSDLPPSEIGSDDDASWVVEAVARRQAEMDSTI